MHKVHMVLLCTVIMFSGCAANAEPELSCLPVLSPSETAGVEPSESPSATPFYTTDISMANEHADVNSNIDNGGFAASDDEHIYLASDKLYMLDLYCNQTDELLNMPDICFLNLYGDYLYFVSAANYDVYRLDKDGQNLKKLPVNGAFNLIVADDSLFYQYSVGEEADNLLYRCDLSGYNKQCLNITASNLCAGETGLYFSNKDDNGYLYKYCFNNNVIAKVRSDKAKQINIKDGSIYYIAANEDNKVVVINSTGSGRQIIVDEPCNYLNHIGSHLIFSAIDSNGIEKVALDGSGREIILDYKEAHAFNIASDYIFFEAFPIPSSDAMTYRIRPDSTGLYPDFPEQSIALIKDFDIANMTLELDYVELLSGEEAVDAYSYDNGLSKKKAREDLDSQSQGNYLRNRSPKIREYKLTNFTNITLVTRSDGSLALDGYSASDEDFAALYASNSELCKKMLYMVMASDGEIISIQQQYYADSQ